MPSYDRQAWGPQRQRKGQAAHWSATGIFTFRRDRHAVLFFRLMLIIIFVFLTQSVSAKSFKHQKSRKTSSSSKFSSRASQPSADDIKEKKIKKLLDGAIELINQGAYLEALDQLLSLYARTSDPSVLFSMAYVFERIGDKQEALRLYEKVVKKNHPDALLGLRAREKANSLRNSMDAGGSSGHSPEYGVFQSPADPARPPDLKPRQSAFAMLTTGTSLLGGGYLAASIAGGICLADSQSIISLPDSIRLNGARWECGTLFIPVAGPFITAGLTQSVPWALPWALVSGGAQLAGLTLAIVGGWRLPSRGRSTLSLYASGPEPGLRLFGRF